MKNAINASVTLGLALMSSSMLQAAVTPAKLRCEYATNPLGIDVVKPRLSWILESGERGQVQKAYQVLVASSEDAIRDGRGDLWDSGRVKSAATLGVEYAGPALRSGQRAWWTVRAWDREDKPSVYAQPAWWETGLLGEKDWSGKWITRNEPAITDEAEMYKDHPAPLLRKDFATSKKIRQARAYVSGLGYYELRLNGKKVGDHVLDPGWTTYSKRVLYSTYDVTVMVREGRNAAGIMLGNGWYNPLPLRMWGSMNPRAALTVGRPRAILQLNIEYDDGSRESVVTDESWKVSDGPIVRNSVYLGEVYDARREQPGWDEPGFDEATWKPAALSDEPVGPLRAQYAPPIRATKTVAPVAITEPKPGVFIFDMGCNFAGWVTLSIRGEAGQTIKLRYGELLHKDGTLNPMTSVCGQIKRAGMGGPGAPDLACQSETYICKGSGLETYTPRFTFHGFRYVEVTGLSGKPALSAIEGHRLNSDVESVGKFECSNEMLNRVQEMVRLTLLNNLFSVQSDCPHREKFGYGGDIIATSEMAMLNYDMARFYTKAVVDLQDAARENGGMTETAPFVGIADDGFGGGSGPIGWASAHTVLQWQLYQYYGDRRLLEEQFAAAEKWVALLEKNAKDSIITVGISDHESLVPKPVELTGTAFYWYNADLLSRIAKVLGKNDDARRYMELAGRIRDAFNAKFLKKGTGGYDSRTQACQAFALYMGLVPQEERDAALKVLVDDVKAHDGHLTTGIFGTKYMLTSLTDAGRADVAYTIASQKTFPGWGHMLASGATAQWEHWEFSDNVYSHDHPMFGSVSEWFFRALAGISAASDAVGFDMIVIRPCVVGDLTWARGEHESIRGPVRSSWRKDGDVLTLEVSIPVNTTATVYVPAGESARTAENGRPIEEAEGVKILRREPGAVVCSVGSGKYTFTVAKP